MNPHLKSLVDVLAAIVVRQLVSASLEGSSPPEIPMGLQEKHIAHAGNKDLERLKGLRND